MFRWAARVEEMLTTILGFVSSLVGRVETVRSVLSTVERQTRRTEDKLREVQDAQLAMGRRLERLSRKVGEVQTTEGKQMAIGEDILARVTAQATTIDSIKVLLEGFVQAGDITPEVAAAITAAFDANDAKLHEIEAALQPAPVAG